MDWKEARTQLIKDVQAIRRMARDRFIQGAQGLRAGIVFKFYSSSPGASVGLARRTGRAANSWKTKTSEDLNSVSVSVCSAGVPYADFGQAKFIRGKPWLVIPVGAGLTPAGVARYPGDKNGRGAIAQAEARLRAPTKSQSNRSLLYQHSSGRRGQSKLSFVKQGTSILVLAKKGVTGPGLTKNKRLLFVMRRVVKRPARTAGLMPFVDESVEKIQRRLEVAIAGYRG